MIITAQRKIETSKGDTETTAAEAMAAGTRAATKAETTAGTSKENAETCAPGGIQTVLN